MVSRTAQAGLQASGTPAPAAYANSVAGGWIGRITPIVADQTVTTETVITGSSLTVTVNTSRCIRLVFDCNVAMSSGAGNRAQFRIKEGTTVLQDRLFGAATNGSEAATLSVILTPSAGSHTYTVSLQSPDGGSAVLKASATGPAMFLIQDIGPA